MSSSLILCYLPYADTTKDGRRDDFIRLLNAAIDTSTAYSLPDDYWAEVEDDSDRFREILLAFDKLPALADSLDVAWLHPYAGEPPILVAGGMISCCKGGDYGEGVPTESAMIISHILSFPWALNLFELWAREDYATVR